MDHQQAIDGILSRLEKDLPDHLHYHGYRHTLDVMDSVRKIAAHEKVSESEHQLLLVAAAYHDAGFLHSAEEHEERGCEMVRHELPALGFDELAISQICSMIMATKVPQKPSGRLARILCDADLDYLGRADFKEISGNLFKELKAQQKVTDLKTWNRIQVKFLSAHAYHTDFGNTFRAPRKQQYLNELIAVVKAYDH